MHPIDTLKSRFEKPGVRIEDGPGGFTSVHLDHGGGSARVCLHGAHVLDYRPAAGSRVLWLSPDAEFRDGAAIRGGIPICWPWFAAHASDPSLPFHGFARNRQWTLVDTGSDEGQASATFELADDAATGDLWPHPFALRYRVRLSQALECSLQVTNTGVSEMAFTAALHSYFSVADSAHATIEGLAGDRYLDKVDHNRAKVQTEQLLAVNGELDRIYLDTGNRLVIHDQGRRLHLASRGSASTVVWNPGPDRARRLQDFPDDGYRRMLCVETANAASDGVRLAADARHTLEVRISAQATGG